MELLKCTLKRTTLTKPNLIFRLLRLPQIPLGIHAASPVSPLLPLVNLDLGTTVLTVVANLLGHVAVNRVHGLAKRIDDTVDSVDNGQITELLVRAKPDVRAIQERL